MTATRIVLEIAALVGLFGVTLYRLAHLILVDTEEERAELARSGHCTRELR